MMIIAACEAGATLLIELIQVDLHISDYHSGWSFIIDYHSGWSMTIIINQHFDNSGHQWLLTIIIALITVIERMMINQNYNHNHSCKEHHNHIHQHNDDIYIMVKCMSVCHVFAYFIFSHFWAPLGLEIREKVSRNRRNDKRCLKLGET